jgi:hypothetical protein
MRTLPTLESYTRIVSALGDPTGKCYAAAEALYHALGGKQAGYTPRVLQVTEQVRDFALRHPTATVHTYRTHWYLVWRGPFEEDGGETYVLDPTVAQFVTAPDYTHGRGCGFLTKRPSAAARAILKRAGLA